MQQSAEKDLYFRRRRPLGYVQERPERDPSAFVSVPQASSGFGAQQSEACDSFCSAGRSLLSPGGQVSRLSWAQILAWDIFFWSAMDKPPSGRPITTI